MCDQAATRNNREQVFQVEKYDAKLVHKSIRFEGPMFMCFLSWMRTDTLMRESQPF